MIIDEIKIGDILIEHHGHGNHRKPVRVTKVFKRYFETGKAQWNDDGFQRGSSSKWCRGHVTLPKPGELEQLILENKISRIAENLKGIEWRKLPLETLEAVTALLPAEHQE